MSVLKVRGSTAMSDGEDMANDTAELSLTLPDKIPALPLVSAVFPPCGPNEFRLLELHSGAGDEALQVTLRTYPLAKTPLYSAVSHTWVDEDIHDNSIKPAWGVVSHDNEISGDVITVQNAVDGQKCWLKSRNLVTMLRDLRDPAASRVLWIDAICINQDDIPERNTQVFNMAQIFSNANCVVIWLSPSKGKLPQEWAGMLKSYQNYSKLDYGSASILIEVQEHRYWTRTWIIQEIILGRRVELQSAEYCIPLDLIIRLLRADYPTKIIRNNADGREPTLPERLHADRAKRTKDTAPTDLWDLLVRYSYSECSDPRDKIFALLSLNENAKQHIKVDYTVRPIDLLLQVVNFLARYEGGHKLDLIALGASLRRQLKITRQEVCDEIRIRATPAAAEDSLLGLDTRLYARGYVDREVSSEGEILVPDCRQKARPLANLPPMTFRVAKTNLDDKNEFLTLTSTQTGQMEAPSVSTRDFYVFSLKTEGDEPTTIGLAPMRLSEYDRIWQLAGTTVAFVGRWRDSVLELFGCTYLATVGHYGFDRLNIIPNRPLPPRVRGSKRRIHLTSALFLELILWADDAE
jgi:hypothetical protein